MPLTQDQLDKLASEDLVAKLCVEIDAASPLRYCTGLDPTTLSGDVYSPRAMMGNKFSLVEPSASTTKVALDDGDKTLRTAWYLDPFSGYVVTVTMLLREKHEHAFSESISLSWYCDHGDFKGNIFTLHLRSSFGHRQRWGLLVGNRTLFPKAPVSGETFKFGSTTTTAPGGGGGGTPNPYVELYGTSSSAYWSLIDPTGQMAFDAGLDKPYWVSDAQWAALSGSDDGGGARRPGRRVGG